ncbi:MAG: hypothetical protein KJ722_06835, partial [Candidatus Omnitrophica bacterium]|nr:hypothetical protein [Candidatus Omnitrophota bacterium]
MIKITDELNLEYVKGLLQYGVDINEMVVKLEEKGRQLAQNIESLEELEGEVEVEGELCVLKQCPMVSVLNAVKKANAELTGEENLPDFYPQIVKDYIENHPEEGAILHPLCIVHQRIRKAFGEKHGFEIQQIACRSGSTGKVVYSKKGLEKAKMNEEEVSKAIGQGACLYEL